MRAPAQIRFERLQKLIQRIADEAEGGGVIVVEGIRDKEALTSIGVRGRILCIQSSRRNPISFAEQFDGEKDVIILTDFDRQGVFLANRLNRILNSQRVHSNLLLWRELRGLTRSEIRSIQELPGLWDKLQTDVRSHRSVPGDLRQHSH